MRILLVIGVLVSVVVITGVLFAKRPGREPQPQAIDVHREPDPPKPGDTRDMASPPPGSRGDRERRGMP